MDLKPIQPVPGGEEEKEAAQTQEAEEVWWPRAGNSTVFGDWVEAVWRSVGGSRSCVGEVGERLLASLCSYIYSC